MYVLHVCILLAWKCFVKFLLMKRPEAFASRFYLKKYIYLGSPSTLTDPIFVEMPLVYGLVVYTIHDFGTWTLSFARWSRSRLYGGTKR